jgi:predicted nucleic acid-binding protein
MIYLADTNVLLRFADRRDPSHQVMRYAVRKLRSDHHSLRATQQNFIEFWNVATRPIARNGLGLSLSDAEQLLQIVERLFPLLPEVPSIYPDATEGIVAVDPMHV